MLFRKETPPPLPPYYEADLAYSVVYPWGGVHVTQEANAAYGLNLSPVAELDASEGSFASRIHDADELASQLHLLVAAQSEYEPSVGHPELADALQVSSESSIGRKGVEAVMSIAPSDNIEMALGANLVQLEHEFGLDDDEARYVIGNLTGKQLGRNEFRSTMLASIQAAAIADVASDALSDTHVDWQRQVYTDTRLRAVRSVIAKCAAAGVGGVGIATAIGNPNVTCGLTSAFIAGLAASTYRLFKLELEGIATQEKAMQANTDQLVKRVSSHITRTFLPPEQLGLK